MARDREHLAAPDILRVACITIVAWYHFWQQSWLNPGFRIGSYYVNLQQIVRSGYMIVDIMLLLSGFLLALPYARRSIDGRPVPPTGDFYARRFWRIVPSYVLTVVVVQFTYAIPRGLYPTAGAMLKDLLAHLTFTHTFFFDTYIGTALPVVLWTLAVEAQFYVLWPVIAMYYVRSPVWTCAGLAGLACAFRGWVYTQPEIAMYINQLPCMLDLYACGMLAAFIFARWDISQTPSVAARRWIAAVGMPVCFAGMLWVMYRQSAWDIDAIRRGQLIWRLPLALFGGGFLACGCLAPKGLARAVGNPLTRFLAGISYNFYIWHQFLACRLKDWHIPPYASQLPNQAGEQPWQRRYTLLCFIAAGVLATAITYLFERPIQKWGLKPNDRQKTAAP